MGASWDFIRPVSSTTAQILGAQFFALSSTVTVTDSTMASDIHCFLGRCSLLRRRLYRHRNRMHDELKLRLVGWWGSRRR